MSITLGFAIGIAEVLAGCVIALLIIRKELKELDASRRISKQSMASAARYEKSAKALYDIAERYHIHLQAYAKAMGYQAGTEKETIQ